MTEKPHRSSATSFTEERSLNPSSYLDLYGMHLHKEVRLGITVDIGNKQQQLHGLLVIRELYRHNIKVPTFGGSREVRLTV